jgi:transcription-repair coupling factor (superfamily II helicase)
LNLQQLIGLYSQSEKYATLAAALNHSKTDVVHLKGLVGSVDAVLAASYYTQTNRSQLFVFNNQEDARYFYADLENLLEGKTVLYFPPSYRKPFVVTQQDSTQVLERAEVLNRLNQHSSTGELVVTSAEALCELVIGEKELTQNTFELKVGQAFDLEFFMEFLTEHHFERADFVYEAGQFSIRGGIVDVFSFSNDYPYRIEFFDNEIESIRTFDTATQLSVAHFDFINIIPNISEKLLIESRASFLEFISAILSSTSLSES